MTAYKVSTDDAALLEEVAIFLDTSGLLLPAVDNEPWLGNEAQAASSGSDSGERSDKSIAGRAAARREKEILRKRRYQRRLKDERETLRQMEQELSSKLAKLEEAHQGKMLSATNKLARINSVWRNLVKQERAKRSQAEQEQKRLIEAVTVQASYLANLRELLPGQVEIGGDTTMAMALDASEKDNQNAQIVCSMDLVV